MIVAVALCSAVIFSSCKKDDVEEINYDTVLQGKWLVESVSPPMVDSYIAEGNTIEFKADHRFSLGSQWDGMFTETLWGVDFDRATKYPIILMLGYDAQKVTHAVLEGRINYGNNDLIYFDYDDPVQVGTTYTFKLVRKK